MHWCKGRLHQLLFCQASREAVRPSKARTPADSRHLRCAYVCLLSLTPPAVTWPPEILHPYPRPPPPVHFMACVQHRLHKAGMSGMGFRSTHVHIRMYVHTYVHVCMYTLCMYVFLRLTCMHPKKKVVTVRRGYK